MASTRPGDQRVLILQPAFPRSDPDYWTVEPPRQASTSWTKCTTGVQLSRHLRRPSNMWRCSLAFAFEFGLEPGLGKVPFPSHGFLGDPHDVRSLFDAEAY